MIASITVKAWRLSCDGLFVFIGMEIKGKTDFIAHMNRIMNKAQ
ncbi:MAG: hypothetical protein WBF77_13240 [Sulfurimonadaceae bacterium]